MCVCVVCVFIKLHITAQSGPVILVILCHSLYVCVCVCVCLSNCALPQELAPSFYVFYVTRIPAMEGSMDIINAKAFGETQQSGHHLCSCYLSPKRLAFPSLLLFMLSKSCGMTSTEPKLSCLHFFPFRPSLPRFCYRVYNSFGVASPLLRHP